MPLLKKTGEWLICEICGKSYYRRPSRIKKGRFCSPACRVESSRHPADLLLKAADLYKRRLTIRQIAKQIGICKSSVSQYLKNNELIRTNLEAQKLSYANGRIPTWKDKPLPPGFRFDRKGTKHNQATKIKMRRSHKHGKDHPNWQGGKTSQNMQIRHSAEMIDWRIAVFERDNFRCLCCGQVGGELRAHHILPFAKYPELRLVVDNGATLCRKCHKNLHRKAKSQIA